MLEFTTQIRVRYADTDQMSFVYNGKYLEYFEVGRTEMLRANGLPYHFIESQGYQLPLLESYVKYLNPAFYDDILNIKAIVEEKPLFKIHIDYKITRNEEEKIITEGFTKHIFINKNTKKAVRPPRFFIDAVNKKFK